jgi:hypothetical protein
MASVVTAEKTHAERSPTTRATEQLNILETLGTIVVTLAVVLLSYSKL